MGHHADLHHQPQPSHKSGHTSEPAIVGQLVKIYPEASSHFLLTAKHDTVVLSKAKEHDAAQQWYKDESHGSMVKDEEGHPAFMLINKESHLALKHSGDSVSLASYHAHTLDQSILWTQSSDVGHGYKAIRPAGNTHLNLDADHASKESGGVKENNKLILYKWNKQENQKWMIVPIA